MAQRREPMRPQVTVLMGGVPVADLPPERRRALAERIRRAQAESVAELAEAEWRAMQRQQQERAGD